MDFLRLNPARLAENNGRPENNNQAARNDAAGQEATPQEEQGIRTEAEGRTDPNEGNETERPGALASTWTFFSSFFMSLFPDPHVL